MDRGVYVRFSGKKRVFYRFSVSPIIKVIWINDTKNTDIQGLMKKYVICFKIGLHGQHHWITKSYGDGLHFNPFSARIDFRRQSDAGLQITCVYE